MSDRRRIIAGNWKMNTTVAEAIELTTMIVSGASSTPLVDMVVCPPSCFLGPVVNAASSSALAVGAQNLHPAAAGAYTGEVSGAMLTSLGVQYVICGHSERRAMFGDTEAWVGEKVHAAFAAGLTPIIAMGETLEQRNSKQTEAVVDAQLIAATEGLSDAQMSQAVVAYEPVWAIGTGLTASPDQAQAVHAFIRSQLGKRFGASVAEKVRIQYGGSVKPTNAAQLLAQPDIDGALVGGASLKAESFLAIINA